VQGPNEDHVEIAEVLPDRAEFEHVIAGHVHGEGRDAFGCIDGGEGRGAAGRLGDECPRFRRFFAVAIVVNCGQRLAAVERHFLAHDNKPVGTTLGIRRCGLIVGAPVAPTSA
jgi:hypothetical protein